MKEWTPKRQDIEPGAKFTFIPLNREFRRLQKHIWARSGDTMTIVREVCTGVYDIRFEDGYETTCDRNEIMRLIK